MTEKEIELKVKELLADMSVEEKIGQMLYVNGGRTGYAGEYIEHPYIEEYYAGTVANLTGTEWTNKMQERVKAASPHNIPAILACDVIAGYRTIYPQPVAEACSFDVELIERDSECIGREALSAGMSMTYAPMMDIARDPRWGRISEGAGEDPYLGSIVAAARVRGLKKSGIASCAKHYIGYGACEGGRDYDTALVSEIELRNTYLPPFKAAVEAGVDTVMPAFNDTLGIPMHCNKYLIDDVLRKELGFKGATTSDYNAIHEIINHGCAADRREATERAFDAGVDIDTGSLIYQEHLLNMYNEGKITLEQIDERCGRVLELKFKLGLFENHYYDPEIEAKTILCDEFKAQARLAAAKSTVLLKNEKEFYPLGKDEKILVVGQLADDQDAPLGWWRCVGEAGDTTSLLTAMKEKSENIVYVNGGNIMDGETFDREAIAEAAKNCDKIVAVVGEPSYISGEAHTKGDISLPGNQTEFIEFLSTLDKPLSMCVIAGRPLIITKENSLCDAVLYPWQFGTMGQGVADVMFGDIEPEGKLCVSFPYHIGQIPIYYNHVTTGRPYLGEPVEISKTVSSYATDFTCHYIDMPNDPLYCFGHGLTYTKFEVSKPRLAGDTFKLGEALEVEVDVANVGDRKGTLTLQLYIHDVAAEVTRPVKELKHVEKVRLEAGEKRTLKISLAPESFEYYHFDRTLHADPGEFLIWAAEDSAHGESVKFRLV
ncbi:MAG: glycoside hydrolase family 3 C-terminal domain-containing protein [Clostridia bacterium]|nr:glycoside hydrolase family 3 C-terminal domain-containing protein [Clostridia bacterium]